MRLLPFLFATAVLFSACDKIESYDGVPTTPPPAGGGGIPATPAGPKLVRVFQLDTTLAHPLDTLARVLLTYDAQGRIATWTNTEFDRATGDSDLYERHVYVYNNATTLFAARTEEESRTYGSFPTQEQNTRYYTFSNGQMLYDSLSMPGWFSYDATQHVPLGGGVFRVSARYISPFGNSTRVGTYYQTYQGDNLVRQVDTSVYNDGISTPDTRRTEFNSTYFNVPNPFYAVSAPIYDNPISDGFSFDDWFNAPRNLVATRTRTQGDVGSTPATLQATYSYRLDAQGRVDRVTEVTTGIRNAHRVLVLQYQ